MIHVNINVTQCVYISVDRLSLRSKSHVLVFKNLCYNLGGEFVILVGPLKEHLLDSQCFLTLSVSLTAFFCFIF